MLRRLDLNSGVTLVLRIVSAIRLALPFDFQRLPFRHAAAHPFYITINECQP